MESLVDLWPASILDRAGQETFWDRQCRTYGSADMTRDNLGELDIVQDFCDDFVSRGYQAEDLVTLGGAIGCRDPIVVTNALGRHGQQTRRIYFNDLSRPMVEAALTGVLSAYSAQGVEIESMCGPIHEIAHRIPPLPRRVIIGVYSARGFTEARPEEEYPYAGLEEYLRNSDILGDRFTIEALGFGKSGYERINPAISVPSNVSEGELARHLSSLRAIRKESKLKALRVVGRHYDKPGFFVSHWFTESGILELMRACFPPERLERMSIRPCAKGFVVCIDPVMPPRGIVTVLNNVIGNVLPQEHADTLGAIDCISA